jgi:3',5'-cyclic AMP phosphodiesterase CpdA
MSDGNATRAPAFTIAHLSDLHLTADDRSPRSEARLFGALRGMNAAFDRLAAAPALHEADLILVTGDVTDRGEATAWEAFWRPLRAAGLAAKVRVVPGNHDLCHLGVRLTDYRINVQRAAAGLAAGAQPTRFPWVEILAGGRVALIGLNSANLGNRSGATNAIGRLGFYQLEALARVLRRVRQVPVVVVALHHSPNIPANRTADERHLARMSPVERWGMELAQPERRMLRLLCLIAGVRLVVHGHLHRFEDRRVNALRIVGAPAATEPLADDHGAHLPYLAYEIGASGRVRVARRSVAIDRALLSPARRLPLV